MRCRPAACTTVHVLSRDQVCGLISGARLLLTVDILAVYVYNAASVQIVLLHHNDRAIEL